MSHSRVLVRTIVGFLLIIAGLICLNLPWILAEMDRGHEEATVRAREKAALSAPADTFARARAYNNRLITGGQPCLGVDPLSGQCPGGEEYSTLLDTTTPGVMATLTYPRVGITVSVGHGTDEKTLSHMAGHLYGSSLPIGGASTHAVIAGHAGMLKTSMFTPLLGAREGDIFYLTVAGRELGYRVREIRAVSPEDMESLRISPGDDLVTLVTCTPPGLNTYRLLVTGQRAEIPKEIPAKKDAHTPPAYIRYAPWMGASVGFVAACLGLVGLARYLRNRKKTTTMNSSE